MEAHVKTKYPNLPEDFPDIVRDRRQRMGITQGQMAKAFGVPTATISQLELRKRNFNYERALQFVRYLKMTDYVLPVPDLSQREPITRSRTPYPIEKDAFYIELDGEIVHVLTYRRLGSIFPATRTEI